MPLLKLPLEGVAKWVHHLIGVEYDGGTTSYFVGIMLLLIFASIAILIIGFFSSSIYSLIDYSKSSVYSLTGTIIYKNYTFPQNKPGSDFSPDLSAGYISPTSDVKIPERFILFVKCNKDESYKIEVDADTFWDKQVNQTVVFKVRIGGISKTVLKTWLL